jgi:hypothetical protein
MVGRHQLLIFAATGEHWISPFDAKEPTQRSSQASFLILKAPTLSVRWPPFFPVPSVSTRLANICRAPSFVPGGQSSPRRRMPIPTSSAMRPISCAVAFSSSVDGSKQSGQQGRSHQPDAPHRRPSDARTSHQFHLSPHIDHRTDAPSVA